MKLLIMHLLAKRFKKRLIQFVSVILFSIITYASAISCGFNLQSLRNGIVDGSLFFINFFPPDWSVFGEMLMAAIQSIVIAFLGTMIGLFFSIIIAFLAASNISNKWIRNSARFIIGIERSIPEILLLLILVSAYGLGVLSGVFALALGCVGMLGKLLADSIEEIDSVTLEAIQSVGANKFQVIWFGIIPLLKYRILNYTLFRFEWNIRLSVILGAIGAGGIGYELDFAFNMLQYHRAGAAFVVIVLMVLVIEQLSEFIRHQFNIQTA